jgi:hypothetical protein
MAGASKPICALCGGLKLGEPPPVQMTIRGEIVWLHPGCRYLYEYVQPFTSYTTSSPP